MKVIINTCFGGFGISIEALKQLVLRNAKCLQVDAPIEYYGGNNDKYRRRKSWEEEWKKDFLEYTDIGDGCMAHPHGFNIYKDGSLYHIQDRSDSNTRTDKDLIEIVEALGKNANGRCASLKIIEVPDGVEWEVSEYDGMEHIAQKHQTWS